MNDIVFNEKHLFETLANIARAFPQILMGESPHQYAVPCLRVNSFAFIKSLDDLSADNLNKDARYVQKNVIFSREWEAKGRKASDLCFEFPMLLIAASDHEFKKVSTGTQKCKKFNLMVVDKMPGKYGDCCDEHHYCSERCEEEVMCDIESLMLTVIRNLLQHGFYMFRDINGAEMGINLAHKQEVHQCVMDDPDIGSANCIKTLDKMITIEKSGTFLKQTAKNLALTTTSIEVCFPCPDTLDLQYPKATFTVLPDTCCDPVPTK